MEVRFKLPPQADSPLARLDARWRLIALVAAMIAACLVHTPLGAMALLLLGSSLAWLAAVPARWLLERLAVLVLLLLLFALPAAFSSLGDAAVIVGRGLSLALIASALIVAAPLDRTFRAASSLGMPHLLVHLLLLAYRYLFLIGDELGRLRIALRVRGFRNRSTGHAWKAVAAATGTLLVRGADRAGRVAAAMRCRGFDGVLRGLDEGRTRWRDVAGFLAIAGLATGLVLVERCAA